MRSEAHAEILSGRQGRRQGMFKDARIFQTGGIGMPPSLSAYSIETLSMQPVTKIKLLGYRLAVLALVVYWIAIFTGTHLPSWADYSPDVNDKTKHFGSFFVLAMLLCYITNSDKLFRRFGTIAAVTLSYAIFDELTQQFVPGRTADVWDVAADAAGIFTAIAVYLVGRWIWLRNTRKKN